MPRCRASYNTGDEFKEYIDIYAISTWRKSKGKKMLYVTLHRDILDSSEVTDILDVGGTPEFEFGATDVEEVECPRNSCP